MDNGNSGYQCVQYPKKHFFLTFKEGYEMGLKCISPKDLELGLKACKLNRPLPPYTLCELDLIRQKFYCQLSTSDTGFYSDMLEMENYFCADDQDRRRILERCNSE